MVGAGPAGCVVARRLVDDGHRVLVVEAGPGWPFPPSVTTVDALAALDVGARFWPGVRSLGRKDSYRLGRGVGGGSAINSMVLMTGDEAGYDRWDDEFGAHGWRWSTLAPHFENVTRALAPTTAPLGPLATAFGAAATASGHPETGPSIEVGSVGFGPTTLASTGIRRTSAADAFLRSGGAGVGADIEPGLSLRADCGVRRVRLERGRTVGVELDDGTGVSADRVVLCAGALGSPRLLARSGVGSGLRPVADHPSLVMTVRLRPDHRVPGSATPPISGLLRWSVDRSSESQANADVGVMVMDHVGRAPSQREYGAIVISLLGTSADGRFDVGGRTIEVEPQGLDARGDGGRLMRAVRHVAELMADDQLSAVASGTFLDDAGTPADALSGWSDDELLAWIRAHPGPVNHPSSTLPLTATGEVGSVDLDGAVRGHRGLYVADGSVLPALPAANPQLPIMAVADRIAAGIGAR